MKKVILFTAAVSVFLAAGAVATKATAAPLPEMESVSEPARKSMDVKVGLGVAAIPDYEGSKDYTAAPIPFVSLVEKSGMSAELLGNVLRVNVVPSNTWRFGPLVRYRAERDAVENEQVDRMVKVDDAIEVGGFAGFDMNNWSLKVDVTHDTSGTYNGTLGGVSLGYTWLANPWRFTLSGSTTIADNKYMQTYFGVTNANRGGAQFANNTYSLGGGVKDVGATFLAGYKINDRWGVTGALRYTVLVDDAADSPLVEEVGSESQVLFGVLATYSF